MRKGGQVPKSDLVAAVAAKTDCSRVVVENVLHQALITCSKELWAGRKVTLAGFGAFCVFIRKAHSGVNPKTREAVNVPEKRVVTFRTGGRLRKLVENK
ncbi:MAG: HU family DNA-binding protein [Caldiserica bacterium]|nr:HU family DNA-binding protein [Caldisericota bacterium]